MNDDNQIAAVMFPSMAQPGTPKPAAQPEKPGTGDADAEKAGQAMFPSMRSVEFKPAAPEEGAKEPDAAEILFGDAALDQIDLIPATTEGLDQVPPEQLAQVQSEWRATLKHCHFEPTVARNVTELLQANYGKEISAEQQAAWRREGDEYVRGLGPDGPAKLGLARELVAADGFLRDAIAKCGLGDHPQLLRMLVEHSWSLKASGRW